MKVDPEYLAKESDVCCIAHLHDLALEFAAPLTTDPPLPPALFFSPPPAPLDSGAAISEASRTRPRTRKISYVR